MDNAIKRSVLEILSKISKVKVLVIGDSIVDRYIFVLPTGRAIKDPILSTQLKSSEDYAGGAVAVANHVSNFAENVTFVTLLGDKNSYQEFIESSLNQNISFKSFVKKDAFTTVKSRFVNVQRNEKMFKYEEISDGEIDKELELEISNYLERELPKYDMVMIADFGHGFINDKIARVLEKNSKYLCANVQSNSANYGFNLFFKYKKLDFITMNDTELRLGTHSRFTPVEELVKEISLKNGFKKILLTLGKNGALYVTKGKTFTFPALATSIKDTVGAGDAVFSITSLFSYFNVDEKLIPFYANCAGAIAVNIMGNKESVRKQDFLQFIENQIVKNYALNCVAAKNSGTGTLAQYRNLNLNDIYIKCNNAIDFSKKYCDYVSYLLDTIDYQKLAEIIHVFIETEKNGKTVYFLGNGGSAATASHFACDLSKATKDLGHRDYKAISLADNLATFTAYANDDGYDFVFSKQLENLLNKDDVVVCISASGNSKNLINAVLYANKVGAKTISLLGFDGGKLKDLSDHSLVLFTDKGEYGPVEDIHMILDHLITSYIARTLKDISNIG